MHKDKVRPFLETGCTCAAIVGGLLLMLINGHRLFHPNWFCVCTAHSCLADGHFEGADC